MGKKLFGYILGAVLLAGSPGFAQNTFDSGSTGADGAFSPTGASGTVVTVPVPASGVFNYTTVTIPAGLKVVYVPNAQNNPVTILASGDVSIAGTISVDGQSGSGAGFGGLGGPGGARGGNAGVDSSGGSLADGPGAGRGGQLVSTTVCGGGGGGSYQTAGGASGQVNNTCSSVPGSGGQTGPKYGSRTLVPLLGGSGGGGGCGFSQLSGGGGGGGGGAILIASSTTITFVSGSVISAKGGSGGSVACGVGSGGGGGSGGAIRMIANTITGAAQILIAGGTQGSPVAAVGGLGFARVEAFNLSGFTVTNQVPVSSGLPSSVTPANAPGLQIISVAGVAAPAAPLGSFQGTPDIILPANQANPVAVVITGTNIPNGSTITVTATGADGTSTTAQTTVSGTTASSTGTASINLSTGLSVLTATTVVDLGTIGELKPFLINGEKVDKVEVAARYGGGTDVTYITHSGRRIRALR